METQLATQEIETLTHEGAIEVLFGGFLSSIDVVEVIV